MMNIDNIISVSGKPGLYKVVAQAKNGLIVESLSTKKRMPVHASEQVSALADIRIYTHSDEIELTKVFQNIYQHLKGKPFDKINDIEKLRESFEKSLPEYDKDRVYNSDIKKVFKWYNELLENNLITIEEKEEKTDKKPVKKKTSTEKAKKSTSKSKTSTTKKTTKTEKKKE